MLRVGDVMTELLDLLRTGIFRCAYVLGPGGKRLDKLALTAQDIPLSCAFGRLGVSEDEAVLSAIGSPRRAST